MEIVCNHCGKVFNSYHKRKYCSKKCWSFYCAKNLGDWTKSEVIGKRNKEEWFRKRVGEGLRRYYQNHQLNFLQGKRADWRIFTFRGIRKMILKIFNNRCIRCQQIKNIDIHHIIPERAGGKNEINNLLPLCRKCHQFLEKNQLGIFNIVKDWEITRLLVRESFLLNI